MSTTADVASDVATAVEALACSPTRMLSNVRTDLESIAAGATKYQLLVTPAGRTRDDSNVDSVLASVMLLLHHKLADSTDEEAFSEGNLQTDLTSMTTRSWWEALTSVFGIDAEKDFEVAQTREGNVYSMTLSVTVIVQP